MNIKQKIIKIGIFGTDILNMNKGVSALGISLIKVIEDICNDNNLRCHFFLFENCEIETTLLLKKTLDIDEERISLNSLSFKSIKDIANLNDKMKNLDFVVDITGGDSFSDIYGKKWMLRSSLVKIFALMNKKRLILAPQTYGPFNSMFAKKIAAHIINNSYSVMSRDKLSLNEVSKLTKRKVELSTDVAFVLPYTVSKTNSKDKKIGINVSQLLWSGGYTTDNQFGLSIDYKHYVLEVISRVLEGGDYEIFLIPHVVRKNKEDRIDLIENDSIACEEVASKYDGQVRVAPLFQDPIEAKTFISGMDLFIGSRMHATIASFSASVPTIPIAYSRKFEGLFSNLNYKYVVDATKLTTEEAIKLTMDYIERIDILKKEVIESRSIIKRNINKIYNDFTNVLIEEKQ